jgi:hypothetical protein
MPFSERSKFRSYSGGAVKLTCRTAGALASKHRNTLWRTRFIGLLLKAFHDQKGWTRAVVDAVRCYRQGPVIWPVQQSPELKEHEPDDAEETANIAAVFKAALSVFAATRTHQLLTLGSFSKHSLWPSSQTPAIFDPILSPFDPVRSVVVSTRTPYSEVPGFDSRPETPLHLTWVSFFFQEIQDVKNRPWSLPLTN